MSEKTCYCRKTPLVIGATQTKILADSMAASAKQFHQLDPWRAVIQLKYPVVI